MDDRMSSAHKSLNLSHACSRDQSDQTVQCDVLTHCAHLYMLYEWVFSVHTLNLTLLLRLVFSLAHNQPRSIFLVCWIHGLVCVHPKQVQRFFFSCIRALLHWNNLVDTSCSQHKIFWQIPTVDIIPESFSSFQDLIILKRDFWCVACNLFNCIQLIILFELFTKRLQNRCNQFWRIRVQHCSPHHRIRPISLPNLLCMLFKVALQGYFDSPTVCEEARCLPNIFTRF